jgi:hypothetical protein
MQAGDRSIDSDPQRGSSSLNPRDWNLGGWYFTIGAVHLLKGQIDEAILCLE